ncbi:MAG: DUF1549 domain-containing protein, partial [Isosphaeraceae bacterium]|nr:DUF1549 domain-containing protein [Isosphaeraceae bacterium]
MYLRALRGSGLILVVTLALGQPAAPALADPAPQAKESSPGAVDFERHVMSLLGRLGCNAGSCHGSFQGRGGLALSLFSHAPARDYLALTRDAHGRRVDVIHPERSLLLLKPTGQVSHEGGQRFGLGSWEYQVLRAWIAQGATWTPGRGQVRRMEVIPEEYRLNGPGEAVPLQVLVEFADGQRLDMTRFCDFRAKEEAIAQVSPTGLVRGLQPGDTAIVVSYAGHLTTARILVPVPEEGRRHGGERREEKNEDFIINKIDSSLLCASSAISARSAVPSPPMVPEVNIIDREVFAKLRKLRIAPSALSDDAEFLRRATIDTIGTLPAPKEIRAFLVDRSPDKRVKKIDELLAHPRHAALWATRLGDITGNDLDAMDGPPDVRAQRAHMWHDWFRRRIAENVPYDQIARGVLCATSRDGQDVGAWIEQEIRRSQAAREGRATDYAERSSLDLFWRRFAGDQFFPLEQMAERTAAAFLGVRIECAQCHKHPFDRWTQADYRAFANLFNRVAFGLSPEARAAAARLLDECRAASVDGALPPIPRLVEVYVSDRPTRRLLDPATNRPLPPRALGGPEIATEGDPREALFAWLVQPDNPYFARNFINRIWAIYLGVGLVEPVDNFAVSNPPSNGRLLDALAREFIASGYDIRRLERLILTSSTYQLSSAPNAMNLHDRTNYARAYPRRMLAEVLVDVLNAALGVEGDFGLDAPRGAGAIEVAPNRVRSPDLARIFR